MLTQQVQQHCFMQNQKMIFVCSNWQHYFVPIGGNKNTFASLEMWKTWTF
jgi:hypothetical protein